ncbi:unnamed protein product [Mesocestoides corti]|uniref:Zinc finger protein n=1 Tax=Mesocestoides corti TaxID=53468 RepID=A0A0R3U3Q3_MESCO|nr:unnamed protein product [Mesocestoides corti]
MIVSTVSQPQDLSMTSGVAQTFAMPNQVGFDLNHPTFSVTECSLPLHSLLVAILNQYKEPQQPVLPNNQIIEQAVRNAIIECLPCKNSQVVIHGQLTITVDSAPPVDVKFATTNTSVTSKRKSYQPVRILPAPSPSCQSPDSGALDLSRAASTISESAPLTPFKEDYQMYHSPGKITTRRRLAGGRRLFSCNQCREFDFRSLQHLEAHTLEVHGAYRCHLCHARFTQRSNLQRHALKHVGFKPFECGVCRRAYYRKDHLMRHMEVTHPNFAPRENINVYLTSSESLDYLKRTQTADQPPLHLKTEQAKQEMDNIGQLDGISSSHQQAAL